MTFSKGPGLNQAQAATVRTQLFVYVVHAQACELPGCLKYLIHLTVIMKSVVYNSKICKQAAP